MIEEPRSKPWILDQKKMSETISRGNPWRFINRLWFSWCYFFWQLHGFNSRPHTPWVALYHLSHSTTPFFAGHFWDRDSLCARVSLSCNTPIYASQRADRHSQPLVEMRSHEIFARISFKPRSSRFLPPK
jgi:hypothetical protein